MSVDLVALRESWLLHLRAERKSPETIKSYGTGVTQFLAWCEETGRPPALTKDAATAFVVHLLEDVEVEAATARARHLSLRRFSTWLADEGEVSHDALLGLKPPKLDDKVIEPLTESELQALVRACQGTGFRDRRDEAIVRVMLETGVRAAELIGMQLDQVDLIEGMAIVERGKGGKGRRVPLGPQACRAIDRYRRMRARHKLASSPALWLGDRNRGFTYFALYYALKSRAEAAGITGFHPHRMRHTWGTRWLAAGGSEGGALAIAGWSRRDMLDRYTKATAAERAAQESRGLNLGDV